MLTKLSKVKPTITFEVKGSTNQKAVTNSKNNESM